MPKLITIYVSETHFTVYKIGLAVLTSSTRKDWNDNRCTGLGILEQYHYFAWRDKRGVPKKCPPNQPVTSLSTSWCCPPLSAVDPCLSRCWSFDAQRVGLFLSMALSVACKPRSASALSPLTLVNVRMVWKCYQGVNHSGLSIRFQSQLGPLPLGGWLVVPSCLVCAHKCLVQAPSWAQLPAFHSWSRHSFAWCFGNTYLWGVRWLKDCPSPC